LKLSGWTVVGTLNKSSIICSEVGTTQKITMHYNSTKGTTISELFLTLLWEHFSSILHFPRSISDDENTETASETHQIAQATNLARISLILTTVVLNFHVAQLMSECIQLVVTSSSQRIMPILMDRAQLSTSLSGLSIVLAISAWHFSYFRVTTHVIFFYVIGEDLVRLELRTRRQLVRFDVICRDVRDLKRLLGMRLRSGAEQPTRKNDEVRGELEKSAFWRILARKKKKGMLESLERWYMR
jgi:hypothetical protein